MQHKAIVYGEGGDTARVTLVMFTVCTCRAGTPEYCSMSVGHKNSRPC